MGTRRSTKTWDDTHEELLSFYGLSLSLLDNAHPEFGSSIRVSELVDSRADIFQSITGDGGGYSLSKYEVKTLPTLINLACYFGYASWGIEPLHIISQQNRGAAIDFTRLLLKHAEEHFFAKLLGPLREHLSKQPQPMYFHCIPATSTETHLMTGELFRPTGPPVLTLLPQSPEVALHYGKTKPEIQQYAGQVLWLVHQQCACRRIREPKQFIEAVKGWGEYIPNPLTVLIEKERIERINPYLITPEAQQALLPEAASGLLPLTAHGKAHQNGG